MTEALLEVENHFPSYLFIIFQQQESISDHTSIFSCENTEYE